jgi:ADP-ribose pyrophosphatase
MRTKTRDAGVPVDYDPSQFPAFAVTVDVVILTMSEGMLHVLLVCRGEAPYEGMWAIPGGFKRPAETLDEAAKRELREEPVSLPRARSRSSVPTAIPGATHA